jgi:hypothetical protein
MHYTTLLGLLTVSAVLAVPEWPIPIPASLLPETTGEQHLLGIPTPRPEHVRLIQTVAGKYQWTGDIEQLLGDGLRLMDVLPFVGEKLISGY